LTTDSKFHRTPEKIAFYQRTPVWCRATATDIGPACRRVIDDLMVDNALFRLRAAQGILGLATKHGNAALEHACATALTAGDGSYRTIKGLLRLAAAAGGDATHREHAAQQHAAAEQRAAAVPAFLRGPHDLFADPGPHDTRARPRTEPASASGSGSGSAIVLHLPTTIEPATVSGTTSETAAVTVTTTSDPTLDTALDTVTATGMTATAAGMAR